MQIRILNGVNFVLLCDSFMAAVQKGQTFNSFMETKMQILDYS